MAMPLSESEDASVANQFGPRRTALLETMKFPLLPSNARPHDLINHPPQHVTNRITQRGKDKTPLPPSEPSHSSEPSFHPTLAQSIASMEPSSYPTEQSITSSPSTVPSITPSSAHPTSIPTLEMLGPLIMIPDSDSPTNSPSHHVIVVQPDNNVEANPTMQFSISLQVFLSQVVSTFDSQSTDIFERIVLNFIIDNANEINILPNASLQVLDVEIIGQILVWKRRNLLRSLEENRITGSNVYFDVDVIATGGVEQNELEKSVQHIFDNDADLFQRKLDLAFVGESEITPEPNTEVQLESTLLPLGVMVGTAVGCSFVAAFILGGLFVYKMKNKEKIEDPVINNANESKRGQYVMRAAADSRYPVQQQRRDVDSYPVQQQRFQQSQHFLDFMVSF